ncbi:MAG: LPS assembly protein LptD, partial [Nitrospirota bacterium]
NHKDFYREFSPHFEIRTNRFLESTGEVSLPTKGSRLYFLSQYWIDLKEESLPVPQKLPELGFVLYPSQAGPFWFSATTAISNFWREEGIYGQRLDVFPRLVHKFGKDIIILQSLGLRETAYSLHRSENNSLHRESIEYSLTTYTRLWKKYGSFTHIIEPSLGYTLITDSEDLPLFDSTELFRKTSGIGLSLLNRFINKNGEFVIFRVTQDFDSELGDRPFLPSKLEIGIKWPLSLRLDTSYDFNTGKLESMNYDLSMRVSQATISAGQRYSRKEDILFYTAGIGIEPYKSWYTAGRLWYDAKEKGLKEVSIDIRYVSQCWSLIMELVRKPGDFSAAVIFELKGLGLRRFRI